jgi:hypothetical protein
MEKGYDGEGFEGPFFDAIAEEGPQDFDEDAVPEGREAEVEPRSEAEGRDRHIDIPEAAFVKLKVGELKEELKKRAQVQSGKKTAVLKRQREALAARIPVRKNVAQQKADRSLSGFPATAFWEVLKSSDDAVVGPKNKLRCYAPTIPTEERDKDQPAKHDFMESFDRPVFEGRMKKPVMTRAGNPKRDKEWNPIFEEVVREKGRGRDDFVLPCMIRSLFTSCR